MPVPPTEAVVPRITVWIVLVAVAACGGDQGSRTGSDGADAAVAGRDTAVTRSGSRYSSSGNSSVPGRRLEMPLPEARMADLSGDTVSLRAVLDRPTVLNFWATWCKPCLDEIPDLVELHGKLEDTRAQVVGIAVASGEPQEIRRFAGEHQMSYDLYHVSQSWTRRHFQVLGLPVTLVVDSTGMIRRRLVGPHSLQTFEAVLRPWTDALDPGATDTTSASAGATST